MLCRQKDASYMGSETACRSCATRTMYSRSGPDAAPSPTAFKVNIKLKNKLPPGSAPKPGHNCRCSQGSGRPDPPPGGGSQDENKKRPYMQLGKGRGPPKNSRPIIVAKGLCNSRGLYITRADAIRFRWLSDAVVNQSINNPEANQPAHQLESN